jgi:hypothetical protein
MPTEPAIDIFRPSTIGWLKGTLAGWGTVLLFVAGILLAILGTLDLGWYWLVLSLAAVGLFVWRWFENLASKYEVTEERALPGEGRPHQFLAHQPDRRHRHDQHLLL